MNEAFLYLGIFLSGAVFGAGMIGLLWGAVSMGEKA